ncbi:hypothetical protein [Mesorhizobium sp. ORS 3428]|uniref:hypothetical protein n=1 Tax=Mesorhizobium sp. ORS 3428 TaxID=540997 RepID=UPI0008D99E2E|nr:hypothetical protein [Mesorhizobium sp. ORS 3428]OHV87908.1 hypothetical protein ORS3428_03785 [Mesorhizobium sp. ORS 3428]
MRDGYLNDDVRAGLRKLRQLAIDRGEAAAFLDAVNTVHAGLHYIKATRDEKEAERWMIDLFNRAEFVRDPEIIARARSPEHWAQRLAANGLSITADEIRNRARADRKFYEIGDEILLTPDQLDEVFQVDNTPEGRARRAARNDHRPSATFKRLVARLKKPKPQRAK